MGDDSFRCCPPACSFQKGKPEKEQGSSTHLLGGCFSRVRSMMQRDPVPMPLKKTQY